MKFVSLALEIQCSPWNDPILLMIIANNGEVAFLFFGGGGAGEGERENWSLCVLLS